MLYPYDSERQRIKLRTAAGHETLNASRIERTDVAECHRNQMFEGKCIYHPYTCLSSLTHYSARSPTHAFSLHIDMMSRTPLVISRILFTTAVKVQAT